MRRVQYDKLVVQLKYWEFLVRGEGRHAAAAAAREGCARAAAGFAALQEDLSAVHEFFADCHVAKQLSFNLFGSMFNTDVVSNVTMIFLGSAVIGVLPGVLTFTSA